MPLDRLLPLLEDSDADARRVVVEVLKGQRERLSIKLLQPFFYYLSSGVSLSAAEVLEVLDEQVPSDLLIELLCNKDSNVRQIAFHILNRQAPQMLSELTYHALAILDGHVSGEVFTTLTQMNIATTLGKLGIVSVESLEKLTQLLDWPHWQVRIPPRTITPASMILTIY